MSSSKGSFTLPFHDYSLCSVCILPQPAFYSQSAVGILHTVCILPLVHSLQSAVRSLRFTLTAMKLRHANHNEIPTRSTCQVSREKAVLDSTALRKHDTQRLFLSCEKKKSISNLHVVDMPLNEPTI